MKGFIRKKKKIVRRQIINFWNIEITIYILMKVIIIVNGLKQKPHWGTINPHAFFWHLADRIRSWPLIGELSQDRCNFFLPWEIWRAVMFHVDVLDTMCMPQSIVIHHAALHLNFVFILIKPAIKFVMYFNLTIKINLFNL